jgi:hypothetical protein
MHASTHEMNNGRNCTVTVDHENDGSPEDLGHDLCCVGDDCACTCLD